ncbi:OprO/OprP family phosphate-selective porin [Geomonas sp. RF6]|uniref:porin n=1 Tax=Geomonas sp. RF6 TaxID=2897342 RepID=UPI001E3A64D9|nr:porin [Geomonas sp. RF6]UFS69302.1 OprO/OprP family phosphate-selective porin [Geomonas sp. RF6]
MLITGTASAATGNPAVDALMRKLVEKGVITREDARQLEDEISKEVAGSRPPAPVKNELSESAPPLPVAASEGKGGAEGKGEGTESKTAKLKLPFELKVRAQTRLDTGDLLVGDDGRYRTESDLYMRRIRLEIDKEFKTPPFGKKLDLNLTLQADRAGQDFRNGRRRSSDNGVDVHYIYGDWTFVDAFAVEVGKHKLPFLRAPLTSSSRQLLIERPAVDGVAEDAFGGYEQPHIMAHGSFNEGALRYYLSYLDGVADLSEVRDLDPAATEVQNHGWGPAFVGRVELAPFGFAGRGGFTEKKKDDTGIGGENHLTLGVDGGFQEGVRYATEDVPSAEADVSVVSVDLAGRYTFGSSGTVTGQLQYVSLWRDFNYKGGETPRGAYVQAGYLLPWTVLLGKLEPAARFEFFDHDRIENEDGSGTIERSYTLGFNHYLLQHSIKWSYNFIHTRFDEGVAEAASDRNRNLHQLLLQLYF